MCCPKNESIIIIRKCKHFTSSSLARNDRCEHFGFRPALKSEYEEYEFHHRARIAMKPGITGMWQVSGRSDITDFEEVVKLDTEYIKNWSMGLDFRILFKTVATVLKRDGSV